MRANNSLDGMGWGRGHEKGAKTQGGEDEWIKEGEDEGQELLEDGVGGMSSKGKEFREGNYKGCKKGDDVRAAIV